jgi:hypothetical protein
LTEQKAARKRELYPKFLDELNDGKYDDISFDSKSGSESKQGAATEMVDDDGPNKPDDESAAVSVVAVADAVPASQPFKLHALFIRSLPASVKRQQLLDVSGVHFSFLYK